MKPHKILLLGALALITSQTEARQQTTGALLSGTIDYLSLDDPTDIWSGGILVVAGETVILPRNLLIDLPANRLTLQQLFADAPPASVALGESGLALLDESVVASGLTPGAATILGNRTPAGNLIAGDVILEKGAEVVTGQVTFINHDAGYLRLNGVTGDDTTGLMVRINDPEGRHTIQSGAGCDAALPNCSPDVRFGLDPDNYTISFTTGYPAGIPSTVPLSARAGFMIGDTPGAASDASGAGDPFCPQTNRTISPVPDSTVFAPIQVGDSLSAEGNFELVNGVYFLSCHTMTIFGALITRQDPSQPDYMTFDEVEWDVPGFQNQRARVLLIGFTTLGDSQLDIFSLAVDPLTNQNNEVPFASTVGNPNTVNQGIGATAPGIFKIRYDVDFIAGVDTRNSPCQNLANAGFGGLCGANPLLADEFRRVAPITREIIGRSRHKATLNPGVITRDIHGNEATNGEYLTPVGLGFPEFVEIDLAALATPNIFAGIPWLLDRRLSPGGCDGACDGTAAPLDPFPFSGLNPVNQAPLPAGAANAIFSFFPFGPADLLAWPPASPPAFQIRPTPSPADPLGLGGGVNPNPVTASFMADRTGGLDPVTVSFTDGSVGNVTGWTWDFGDGMGSSLQNPVHTYNGVGTYSVSLTVRSATASDSVSMPGLITVMQPAPILANFAATLTAGVAPLATNFLDASVGTVSAWSWDFGDGTGSSLQSPAHVYAAAGLYTVSLTVTGPDGSNTLIRPDLINVTATVSPPVASFVSSASVGTAPLAVNFTDTSTGDITSWLWSFGDGNTAAVQNAAHVYGVPGTYSVSLTTTGPAGSDTVLVPDLVVVTPAVVAPVARFLASPTSGEAPLVVNFADDSTGTVSSWAWDFGDGSASSLQNPIHTYAAEGVYSVVLTVSGPAGSDTFTSLDLINVLGAPPVLDMDFTANVTTGPAPLRVRFTPVTLLGTPVTALWDFGDGTTSTVPLARKRYNTPGTYTVTLTATDADGNSVTVTKPGFITVQ